MKPTAFQMAVRTNNSHEERHDAIDSLVREHETTSLGILVRMDGLRGEFRRHALHGLMACNGEAVLEELATDTTIEPTLRRRTEALT